MGKIYRYRIGKPLQTEAVVQELPIEKGDVLYLERVQKLDLAKEKADGQECLLQRDYWRYPLTQEDRIYGLGENVRGINKRGWIYESNCTDDPIHTETKHSLYGAHNFFVVDGEKTFGLFLDYPGKLVFDMGYQCMDELRIIPKTWDLELYLILGDDILDIVKQFRQLTGRSYIPPKWAFGFGQSRWGYQS